MLDERKILRILNDHYPMRFDTLQFERDSGCAAYSAFANGSKYFLRITKPMFYETAARSLDIHLFLLENAFSVPQIFFTKDGQPYVLIEEEEGSRYYVLYEFVEGTEVDPEQDAEAVGAFLGKLHQVMKAYPGSLVKRDKHYYMADTWTSCVKSGMTKRRRCLPMARSCGKK